MLPALRFGQESQRKGPPNPIQIPTTKPIFNAPPAAPIAPTFVGASKANISSVRFDNPTAGNVGGFNPNTSSNTQTGSLFGQQSKTPPSQPQPSLFGATSSAPSSLFGATTTAPSAQPQPAAAGSGLFGGGSSTLLGGGLGASQNTANPAPSGNTLGGLGSNFFNNQKPAQPPRLGSSLNLPTFGQSLGGASGAKIDLEHLRPTTKFDNLTDQIQNEIQKVDEAILDQINMSHEVSDLLPTIDSAGSNIDNDIEFVARKQDELEIGLENDAEDIQRLREGLVKKDAVEARVAFRQVDRLKMPSQYQTPQDGSFVTGATGLSGWWNHPQTLQRNLRASTASGKLKLPGDDDPDASAGPANLVEFFDKRTAEMSNTLGGYKDVLKEIEEHLDGVEASIYTKHRELIAGSGGESGIGNGREEQSRNLVYALGVFERSIIDVAGKMSSVRNDVQDLMIGETERRNAGFARSIR